MSLSFVTFFSIALAGITTASFVAPVEKNPPFRRDRLPINSDLMISLSRDLTTLTQAIPLERPEQRRSAAQALALAVALDPANQSARDIVSALAEGTELERPESGKFDSAKRRIWKSYEWLSLPQAGSDGNTFAALLGEPAHVLDNDRQKPAATQPNNAAWEGWVAPLESFRKKKPNDLDPFDELGTKKPDEDPEPAPGGKGSIALKEASIETVLYDYDDATKKWRQVLCPVKLKASNKAPESEDIRERFTRGLSAKKFEISIPSGSSESFRIRRSIIVPVEKALAGRLPEQGQIRILPGSNDRYNYKRNQNRLSGPAFILANAAVTGIDPGGIVLAEINNEGDLVVPKYFWQLIATISEVEGKKIILPKGSEKFLINLLTLNKVNFFLKNEVVLASSTEQYIAFCAKEATPEQLAISERFQEIADKAEGKSVGPYLTNRFVRQRLEEIVSAAPYHMSAKLLVRQGSPVRPRYLSKEVLAAEVWRAIEPMNILIESGLDPTKSNQVDAIYEPMREKLESLERYADLRSQDVIAEGKELLSKMRNYSRNLRGRGELWERFDEISAAWNELVKTNGKAREALAKITGDPLPEEQEDLERKLRRDQDR